MKYIVIILSIFFVACQNKPTQKDTVTQTEETQATEGFTEINLYEEEDIAPVIIDSVFLVRRSDGDSYGWQELKYQPNETSGSGGSINLGGKLHVIAFEGDWLKVWTWITRDKAGDYIPYEERKMGSLYIQKELTGQFEELFVSEEELSMIGYNGVERYVSTDTLSFELISKNEYISQKITSVSAIVYDTLNIQKQNGVITLPCVDTTVSLTDVDTDGDNLCYYYYLGQIPSLNVYLIRGQYFESGSYFFIDKNTGERTATFGDFPMLSPDGKYIVDIWGNLYDNDTEFVFSKVIHENSVENIFTYYFTKWLPFNSAYYKEIDYFWGDDSQLYIKIQTPLLSAQIYEDYAAQYMKVKIGLIDAEES